MTAYSDAVTRLTTAYYNSGVKSVANPGGFAGFGHAVNFPLALADVGIVFDELDASLALIAGAAPAAAAAAASAADALAYKNLAQTAKTDAEAAATSVINATAAGRQTIPLPASFWRPRQTDGPALNTTELAGQLANIIGWDFSQSTPQYLQAWVPMPKGWNLGTVTFRVHHRHAAATTDFGVVYGLRAVAISDDETLDVARGAAIYVTDTGGTTDKHYASAESAAVTIAGTPAAMDLVLFEIFRATAEAGDTMNQLSTLTHVEIFATMTKGNDA